MKCSFERKLPEMAINEAQTLAHKPFFIPAHDHVSRTIIVVEVGGNIVWPTYLTGRM